MEYDFDNKYETDLYNKESINDYISIEDLSILYLNIRGLKTNYNNLEIFIQNFKIKPDIIICAETGNINKSDGVVVYISKYIVVSHDIVVVGRVKFLNITIKLKNGKNFENYFNI